MTRANDIASLVDSNGDIVAGALDNVPASNDASALTTGTLDAARLPTEIVSSDTTPQLGGNLDAQNNQIVNAGNISNLSSNTIPLNIEKSGGTNWLAQFKNTSGTPYGVSIYETTSAATGYPLLAVNNHNGSTSYLRVDSISGVVTKPKTPAFHSASGTGSNQTGAYRIGSTDGGQNTYYVRDNGSNFSTSNGRFTAPVAGWYFFHAMASPSQGANSGIYITKNGSQTSGTAYIYGQSYNGGSISAVIQMAANDYAEGIHAPFNGTNEGQYAGAFTGFLIG